jgi:hypothetical protein
MFMEDQQTKMGNFTKQLEGESLLRFLGDDLANKVRKADLARLRGGQAKAAPRAEAKQEKPLPEDPQEAERERQRRRREFWQSSPHRF